MSLSSWSDELDMEPSPETDAVYARLSEEAEANQTLSQADIDREIEVLRASPAFNSKDPLVRGPAVDRLMLLTSGQPVPPTAKGTTPDIEGVPDNIVQHLDDSERAMLQSESELKKAWGSNFEANVEMLQDFTASADERLGGNGRVFSEALELAGLANSVPFAKSIVDVMRGGEGNMSLNAQEAQALLDQLSQPGLVYSKNPVIRESIAEGLRLLHEIVYGGDIHAGDPLPKSEFDISRRPLRPGELTARYYARQGRTPPPRRP